MKRAFSCLILVLVSCVVDREMYDGRYETEVFASAEQGVGDFGQTLQAWASGFAPVAKSDDR